MGEFNYSNGKMDWYSKSVEEIFKSFDTASDGLTRSQFEKALLEFGPNKLREKPKPHAVVKFLGQFKSVPILMLIAATIILVLLTVFTEESHLTDAIVILIVIFLNATMGYIQEARAEKAMEALKKLTSPRAKVLREGLESEIDFSEVVPGDILLLEEGDRIPADGRVLEVYNLEVDESMLTGESNPVRKGTEVITGKIVPVSDQLNTVFMGTVITRGRGRAIAVATGMGTEIGKIARVIQEEEDEETPLQQRLDALGKQIGVIAIAAMIVLFAIDMLIPPSDIVGGFLLAVSLAVAIIPEGLPIVTLVTLAVGMQIMAKKNAVIRKLMAVETLGCTTFICSDKTGTLTKNEMTVREMYIAGRRYRVTGEGYNPEGEILIDGEPEPHEAGFQRAMEIMALCNNAHLLKGEEKWSVIGDPTEGALLSVVGKAKLNPKFMLDKLPRVGEKIFDPKKKMMTTVHEAPEGKVAFIKGAPEMLLSISRRAMLNGELRELSDSIRSEVESINLEFASKAYRVLAIGYKQVEEGDGIDDGVELERGMTFVGILGIMDPPRSEAKQAIDLCRDAGIKTVMITGDQKNTAIAVAGELGLLEQNGRVLTGSELDQIDSEEFKKIVEKVSVYARVSPEHKMKIVDALKQKGQIVAMTGDGVNDAPALTKADIGISMGISGTDVAKESSDMVLMDDNFSSIVAAIEEGRRIYDNIRKFIRYQLSTNVGAILLLFISTILVPFAPMYPVQLLWINIMMDGPPAIALGLEPPSRDIMKRSPRDPDEKILSNIILRAVFFNGIVMGIGAFLIFYWAANFSNHSDPERYAQTMTFTGFVIFQMFNVFNCRSLKKSAFKTGLTSNKFLLLAIATSVLLQILVVYTPLLNITFHTIPLEINDWLIILSAASSVLIIEEFKKAVNKGKD